jgi:pyruvate formate lyase activating enzyme
MSQSLVNSRFELHVTRKGAAQTRAAHDYLAILPGDVEKVREQKDLVGYIHSYEVGTTVDGPGIRLVAFLTGCTLRCQYCHNPDTWHKYNGHAVPLSRAMTQIRKYAQVLKMSGGGVTLSGGEPMVQRAFMNRILKECKELGLHTCVETSGRLGEQLTDEEVRNIDLVILDVKGGEAGLGERVTKQPLQPSLDFGKRLAAMKRPMWIRFVLVPGLTDGKGNVEGVAKFAASLGTVERVEVLPFHQMGRDKWKKLGIDYALADTMPPEPALVERVRAQFRGHGLTVY